jgi:hypothetical protein
MSDLPPLFAEEHVCERCGLAYLDLSVDRALALVVEASRTLAELLPSLEDETLRRRPSEGVWSVIEYAGHVRDVLVTFAVRVHRGVHDERPSLDPMYNDWRAERFGYNAASVVGVVESVRVGAAGFAAEVRSVPDDAWDRVVTRLPMEERTVRWLVRQAAHECVHHLADITALVGRPEQRHPRTSGASAPPSPAAS